MAAIKYIFVTPEGFLNTTVFSKEDALKEYEIFATNWKPNPNLSDEENEVEKKNWNELTKLCRIDKITVQTETVFRAINN